MESEKPARHYSERDWRLTGFRRLQAQLPNSHRHIRNVRVPEGAWSWAQDSLLFVAGALAALGGMHIHLLVGLLIVAAILGDTLNYHVGKHLGHRLVARPDSRWFHHEWLDRTHAFYDRHGGKTVVIARFVPIVRTFAPFVAGMGSMAYGRFLRYNVLGGIAWVTSFAYAGYWFGNVPVVKQNLSLLIVAIVGVSMLPGVVGYLRHRRG